MVWYFLGPKSPKKFVDLNIAIFQSLITLIQKTGGSLSTVMKAEIWTVIGQFQDQAIVSVEPFQEIGLELGALWEPAED